ncbi:MAG: hypothetical protein U9P80_02785 [Thermodesulfobacteriota bacterium]|nr:hypothetical protein [Thermodesulfobacteriota bacterium]
MGTKRSIVRSGEVYAGGGRSDTASVMIIPLLGPSHNIENVLLLHVAFNEDLTVAQKKACMGDKFDYVNNLVNEYNLTWRDEYIKGLSIKYLLGEDVEVITNGIRASLQNN